MFIPHSPSIYNWRHRPFNENDCYSEKMHSLTNRQPDPNALYLVWAVGQLEVALRYGNICQALIMCQCCGFTRICANSTVGVESGRPFQDFQAWGRIQDLVAASANIHTPPGQEPPSYPPFPQPVLLLPVFGLPSLRSGTSLIHLAANSPLRVPEASLPGLKTQRPLVLASAQVLPSFRSLQSALWHLSSLAVCARQVLPTSRIRPYISNGLD